MIQPYCFLGPVIMQSCDDVRVSLMTCCGIAVVYSVGAISAAVASGVNPEADM